MEVIEKKLIGQIINLEHVKILFLVCFCVHKRRIISETIYDQNYVNDIRYDRYWETLLHFYNFINSKLLLRHRKYVIYLYMIILQIQIFSYKICS